MKVSHPHTSASDALEHTRETPPTDPQGAKTAGQRSTPAFELPPAVRNPFVPAAPGRPGFQHRPLPASSPLMVGHAPLPQGSSDLPRRVLDGFIAGDTEALMAQVAPGASWFQVGIKAPWSGPSSGAEMIRGRLQSLFEHVRVLDVTGAPMQEVSPNTWRGRATWTFAPVDPQTNVAPARCELITTLSFSDDGQLTKMVTVAAETSINTFVEEVLRRPERPTADDLWDAARRGEPLGELFVGHSSQVALPSHGKVLEVLRVMRAYGFTADLSDEQFPVMSQRSTVRPTDAPATERLGFRLNPSTEVEAVFLADGSVYFAFDMRSTGLGTLYTPVIQWERLVSERQAAYAMHGIDEVDEYRRFFNNEVVMWEKEQSALDEARARAQQRHDEERRGGA